jgi:hypothetical protein
MRSVRLWRNKFLLAPVRHTAVDVIDARIRL